MTRHYCEPAIFDSSTKDGNVNALGLGLRGLARGGICCHPCSLDFRHCNLLSPLVVVLVEGGVMGFLDVHGGFLALHSLLCCWLS